MSKYKLIDNLNIAYELKRDQKSLWDPEFPGGTRMCEHLKINDELSLSVQASENHYCTPRALVPLDKYETFEMAFIFNGEISQNIVTYIEDFKRKEELLNTMSIKYFNLFQ